MPPSFGSMENFYPRPPRGGRPVFRARYAAAIPISIHALREEGDGLPCATLLWRRRFLSTPSARRATVHHLRGHDRVFISIHALREEGDVTRAIKEQWPIYFYPRPPRGGRPVRCF